MKRKTRNLRFKDDGVECLQNLARSLKKIAANGSEPESAEIARESLVYYDYANHRVRFTETENDILISKAATSRLTVSAYMRKATLQRVGRVPSPRLAVIALLDVLALIRKRYPLDRETPAILVAAIRSSGGFVVDDL